MKDTKLTQETDSPKDAAEATSIKQFFCWLAFITAMFAASLLCLPYLMSLTASVIEDKHLSGIEAVFDAPAAVVDIVLTASAVPDTYGFTDCDVIVETSTDSVTWTQIAAVHFESVSGSGKTFTIPCGETTQHLRIRPEGRFHQNSFDLIRINALPAEVLNTAAPKAIFVPGGIAVGQVWVGTGAAVAEVWDAKTDTKVWPAAE
ncbi:MAG: hypothetical protein LBT46_15410 [Planctomycetaceae bacterium]|jgi:hypothetical protein|nr:hypothetical protein [Planctomycetaceae bacterium]